MTAEGVCCGLDPSSMLRSSTAVRALRIDVPDATIPRRHSAPLSLGTPPPPTAQAPALRVDMLDAIIPIAKAGVERLCKQLEDYRGSDRPGAPACRARCAGRGAGPALHAAGVGCCAWPPSAAAGVRSGSLLRPPCSPSPPLAHGSLPAASAPSSFHLTPPHPPPPHPPPTARSGP